MTRWLIKEILLGRVDVGAPVIVEGWLRTRRDSKAGLSFLLVHDGSCFEPIQVVAEASLPNYQTEILHLTTHCAVRVAGTLIESQGKGQRFEVKADRVDVIGWVENPDSYPVSAKRHTMEYLRTVAHLRPRTNTFGAVARVRDCLVDGRASVLPRARFRLGTHSDHHDQRCRGRRGDVPRIDARPRQSAARRERGHRLLGRLLRQARQSDRLRPAQRRGLLPRCSAGCIPSGPRSAPRIPTRLATSPSSG